MFGAGKRQDVLDERILCLRGDKCADARSRCGMPVMLSHQRLADYDAQSLGFRSRIAFGTAVVELAVRCCAMP